MSLPTNTIYERIIYIYKEVFKQNYNQTQIAEDLNVSPHLIGKWKNGRSKPSMKVLQEFSDKNNVSLEWLLTGENTTKLLDKEVFDLTTCLEPTTKEYVDANILGLEVKSTGYIAGDSEYGCRAYIKIIDHASTHLGVSIDTVNRSIEIGIGGGAEYQSLTKALKDAATILEHSSTSKSSQQTPVNIESSTNSVSTPPNNFYEIPYFPDGIAAGNPREVSDHPDGVVILHKDWCPHPGDTSAARLSSTATSMEPTIMAGSIITVDHSMTDPKELDGEVVAIHKKDDGITVKRLKKIGKRWCGAPDNPDYDIIEIEEGDHIVGLVTTHHNRITNKR